MASSNDSYKVDQCRPNKGHRRRSSKAGPTSTPLLLESGQPYIIGDPSQESVCLRREIYTGKAPICDVDSDAINVYITLSARALNAELFNHCARVKP